MLLQSLKELIAHHSAPLRNGRAGESPTHFCSGKIPLCGDEIQVDKLDWPKAETAQECTLTRSYFRDEISRIQSFANDECGH